MNVEETNLKDCWIIKPDVFEDERGYFYEGFNLEKFKRVIGFDFQVKQINQSGSSKGVLRGLHFQKKEKAQAKLVSCVQGEVLDVAVDLRKDSSSFKQYCVVRLSEHNRKHLYIPKGMAHGFLVLTDYAKLMYQTDEFYSRNHDAGIIYNDPEINIGWSIPKDQIILSNKDQKLPRLKESQLDF